MDTTKIASEKRAITVYTDGSPSSGLLDVAAVVTRRNPIFPKVVKTIRGRGACFTCSYEEEKGAVEEAVQWL